ncbi:MAG TPA: hypothetical protein PKN65_10800, partial [Tenuifilaceae bacterium]|nr:hypothetical protein [Tenuifilaceae bacterium]
MQHSKNTFIKSSRFLNEATNTTSSRFFREATNTVSSRFFREATGANFTRIFPPKIIIQEEYRDVVLDANNST